MKKNVTKLLFLVSLLSIGNTLSAYNENTGGNKKPPIEIRIDDGKNQVDNQVKSSLEKWIHLLEEEFRKSKILLVQ